ncbi:MAG: FAD-binding oxidoreductase [Thiolinea sp.]
MMPDIDLIREALTGIEVLDQAQALDAYQSGARGDAGLAAFVMRPETTQEVSRCVAFCVGHNIDFVPQSGNTGLVGGSVPDNSGTQAVLSLERLKGSVEPDRVNRSVSVGAGLRLSELNARLERHGLFLPIDLGADPMIGGMIATNTGGSRFLRYGDMRRQVLGLTVVLPDEAGTVLELGAAVRKNNTGPDWKQHFIGTSGQFGVITEAILSLEPVPQQQAVALLVPANDQAVISLLQFLENKLGSLLSAYELMSGAAMKYALQHASGLKNPFSDGEVPAVALLVELSRTSPLNDWETPLDEVLEQVLAEAWESADAPLDDVLLGRPEPLWALRHALSEGVKAAGKLFAFDLGFTRGAAIDFRAAMLNELPQHFPELEICDFGHIGDGGLHFNLVCHDQSIAAQPGYEQSLRDWVMAQAVERFGGSFSAEHGIGPKNQRYYERYVPEKIRALQLQRAEEEVL